MSPKWTIGLITLWVILSLLGGIIEYAYLGAAEESKLEVLLSPLLAESIWDKVGSMVGAVVTMDWWNAVAGMLLFDYAMFQGAWVIVQWIFFLPLAIAIIVSFMMSFLSILRG